MKIKFRADSGRQDIDIVARSRKLAVEKAVRDYTDLSCANLKGANLSNAQLIGARLSQADIRDTVIDHALLDAAVLDYADLSGADLHHAHFHGTNLMQAVLKGTNLRHANITWSNLSWANLSGADLREANVKGTNLAYADLSCTHIDGPGLRFANIYGANFYGAWHNNKKLWRIRPVLQLGQYGSNNYSTIAFFYEDNSEPMIYSSCFEGNIHDCEDKIHAIYAGTFQEYECMAMIKHIRKIRKYQLKRSVYESYKEEVSKCIN